jgi:hypothetical protein
VGFEITDKLYQIFIPKTMIHSFYNYLIELDVYVTVVSEIKICLSEK